MKLPLLTVLCAAVALFASACHNSSSSPTQPLPQMTPTRAPGSPTPTAPPGQPTPTPTKPPTGGATRVVNVGPGMVFTDTQSGTSATAIKVGDTVQWNFQDTISHSTTSGNCCTANGLWDSGVKTSGTFSHTFSAAGTFPYFCTVHGSLMTGTVSVSQ